MYFFFHKLFQIALQTVSNKTRLISKYKAIKEPNCILNAATSLTILHVFRIKIVTGAMAICITTALLCQHYQFYPGLLIRINVLNTALFSNIKAVPNSPM